MKIRIIKTVNILCIAIVALFISHCATRDGEFAQDNPFDPNGNNWTKNIVPTITADIKSKPLWYDYDFQKDAGIIRCSISVSDKNGKYDTLAVMVLLGTSSNSFDTTIILQNITLDNTLNSTLDSVLLIQNLKTKTKYYYKFIVVDTWDSAGIVAGDFTTPDGRPPEEADSLYAVPNYSYVTITWYGKALNTQFKLYRSDSKSGPFATILDTIAPNIIVTYPDILDDYSMYYYVVASVNKYGECRSKKEVIGYKYSSSMSYPSSVNASDGSYSTYISVSWYSVSNAAKYYIHRGRTASDAYMIIDSTPYTSYKDTMRDTSTHFCYRISAANSLGERGRPSTDYDFGYVRLLGNPYSVYASDGTYADYIEITWSIVSGAAGYFIYRSLSYSGLYTFVDSSAITSYLDSVKTMDYYYYKIAAYDAFGRVGNLSSYNNGYITQTIIPPTSVAASQGTFDGYISVSWSTVSNATGYCIYRSLINVLDSFSIIDTISSTVYNDSVPTADNYYYAVAARDNLGRMSRMSSTTYGYIERLSTPSISSVSNGLYYTHIAVSWSSVSGADGYYIFRSDSSYVGPYLLIDSTAGTLYNDSSISDMAYYYYKLAAYNTQGKVSPLSAYAGGSLKQFSYPTNIKASQYIYKDRFDISWDEVPVATGYNVYKSTSTSTSSFTKIATVTENSYTDSASGSQNYYYYKVSSSMGSSESVLSSYVRGNKLIPPTDFSATGYSDYILLGWDYNSAYAGYYIYRSSDNIDFLRVAALTSGSTSYYRDSVQDFRTYYYKIASFSTEDESDFTNIDSAQKLSSVPQNLTANSYQTHIALQWNPSSGAESYNVYRGTSSSASSLIGNTTQTTYNDSLSVSTKYYYRVASVNKGGTSLKSNYIYISISVKPSMPTNFSAVNSPFHIYLNWSVNSGEQIDGSYVYRSDSSAGTYTRIKTVATTNCYDTVMNGQVYYYKVSAYNNVGESDQTPFVSGKRTPPVPPASLSIQSEQYDTHLPTSWSISVGADGYYIYRSLVDSAYTKFDSSTSLFYNDSSVLAETVYFYKISAYNVIGEGESSLSVSGKKLSQRPVPQEGISIGKAEHEAILISKE